MRYEVVGFNRNKYGRMEGCDIYCITDHLHQAVDFAKDSIRRGQFDAIEIHEINPDRDELLRVWYMGKTLTLESEVIPNEPV